MPEYHADEELVAYARRLMGRTCEGQEIPRRKVRLGAWEPVPNECHGNVSRWCRDVQNHKEIRGWLVMDFSGPIWQFFGQRQRMEFIAHSVVEDEHGSRFDITPSRGTGAIYPFIPHVGTE